MNFSDPCSLWISHLLFFTSIFVMSQLPRPLCATQTDANLISRMMQEVNRIFALHRPVEMKFTLKLYNLNHLHISLLQVAHLCLCHKLFFFELYFFLPPFAVFIPLVVSNCCLRYLCDSSKNTSRVCH